LDAGTNALLKSVEFCQVENFVEQVKKPLLQEKTAAPMLTDNESAALARSHQADIKAEINKCRVDDENTHKESQTPNKRG